jgi:integrase
MATIRKLSIGNKPWQSIVRIKGTRPRSRTFSTKCDAIRWANQIETEIAQGVFTDVTQAERLTFASILERYRLEIVPQKRGQRQFFSQIRTMLNSNSLKSLALLNVTPSAIGQHRDARLASGVSPSTVRKDLAFLHKLFEVVIKDWHINLPQGNPVALVSRPQDTKPTARTRRLDNDELDSLIDALSDTILVKNFVLFAIETAMRRSEITNIQSEHISFVARTLHIPKTKTGIPRTIPLSTKAISILKHVGQFDIKPDSVSQAFNRACKRAKIEDLRLHDLRHEATSRLFEKGFTPMQVASITGHKDLKMLQRYTHLRAEDLAKKLG